MSARNSSLLERLLGETCIFSTALIATCLFAQKKSRRPTVAEEKTEARRNLVQLASRVVSTRDAWWKHDKPLDSRERDDFLGAIADLTEAVLHAPPMPAASATEPTEKE